MGRLSIRILITLSIIEIFGFYTISASPKVNENENLNWPNFFSPKQSILRENEDKDSVKERKKNEDETDSGIKGDLSKNEYENATDDSLGSDDEDLIDYKMTGGLRGTYALLNSTIYLETLSEEAQTTINKILEDDKELYEGVDETLSKGETTEEGVRLRTPMVLKTYSKSLGKYGARISFFGSEKPTHLIYFGNWCGRGGRSAAVDNLDGCCLEQEKCYGKLVRQCPDVWKKPYRNMYSWLLLNEDPVCVRYESTCVNHVCECDREAALCFRHFLTNPSEIPLKVNPSPILTSRREIPLATEEGTEEDSIETEKSDEEFAVDEEQSEEIKDDEFNEDYTAEEFEEVSEELDGDTHEEEHDEDDIVDDFAGII